MCDAHGVPASQRPGSMYLLEHFEINVVNVYIHHSARFIEGFWQQVLANPTFIMADLGLFEEAGHSVSTHVTKRNWKHFYCGTRNVLYQLRTKKAIQNFMQQYTLRSHYQAKSIILQTFMGKEKTFCGSLNRNSSIAKVRNLNNMGRWDQIRSREAMSEYP